MHDAASVPHNRMELPRSAEFTHIYKWVLGWNAGSRWFSEAVRDGHEPVAAPLANPAAPDSIAPMVGAAMSAAAPAATPLPATMHGQYSDAASSAMAASLLL